MKQITGIALFLAVLFGIGLSMVPVTLLTYTKVDVITTNPQPLAEPLEPKLKSLELRSSLTAFLESKDSPLANHVETLLKQEHWKLITAISAIESQYCKRQLGNNCWGITDSSGAYKSYESFDEAIIDANGLITRWQARGRWLTVADMNGHYVVPYNPNWEAVVNSVLTKLESYEQGTGQVSQP
jgi:hypothetical protein